MTGEPAISFLQNAVAADASRPQSRPPSRYRKLGVCGLLILAVGLVFGQTVGHAFINFDDNLYVYENPQVNHGMTASGIVWAFTKSYAGNWHPLSWLSHMLDCQLFGLKPGGHHLTNLLLHAAASVVLLLALARMTGDFWPSAVVAAIFAIHPQHVESVAWIAERKDVLSGLFFMLTLWAYAGYARVPFSLARYLLVISLFALGLMAKSMLVTLPLALLLLDYWPLRRFGTVAAEDRAFAADKGRDRAARVSFPWRVVVEKLPLVAMAAGASLTTLLAQSSEIEYLIVKFPMTDRISNALVTYVGYVAQFFYPVGLALFYPHPGSGLSLWKVAGALLLLVGVFVGVVLWRRTAPWLFVGWFWYWGMLVPVIGLIQVGLQAKADRYTYLPQIGLSIAVVWGVMPLFSYWPKRRLVPAAAALLAIAVLMGCAWRQASYWRDNVTVWEHTLAVAPRNEFAHNNLALALAGQGKVDEAIEHYKRALEIQPKYAKAHSNWGNALGEQGNFDEAIGHFQQALAVQPDYAFAHYNWAVALTRHGKLKEAIAHYRSALKTHPNHVLAYNDLATSLAMLGETDEAIADFRRALEIDPTFASAHNNLANTLSAQGKVDEAIEHYRKALEIDPLFIMANNNLAGALASQGKIDEAAARYLKTLEMQPRDPEAHGKLANLLAAEGKLEDAITHYESSLQLAPNQPDAHFGLGNVLYGQGKGREAVWHWREAVRLQPDRIPLLQRLAWLMATSPDESIRNGPKAIELAGRAVQLSGGRDPSIFDGLAAAYAETGQFPQAVQAASRGLALAEAQGNQPLASAIRARLRIYREGNPYRETLQSAPQSRASKTGPAVASSTTWRF